MTGPTREEVICTWPSCGHSARGQCNSHQLTALRPGNRALDILAAENAALRERLEAAEARWLGAERECNFLDNKRKIAEFECNNNRAKLELAKTALTESRAREAVAETQGWNAAIEAAADIPRAPVVQDRIRALRRNPKEGV